MASSSDSIFGITAAAIQLPTGATNAVLIGGGAYARSTIVKYASGNTSTASAILFGLFQGTTFPNGATVVGSSLVAGFSNGYALGASEILTLAGAPLFYAVASGASAILSVLQGLSDNPSPFN